MAFAWALQAASAAVPDAMPTHSSSLSRFPALRPALWCAVGALTAFIQPAAQAQARTPIWGFDDVAALAKAAAGRPYEEPKAAPLPPALRELDYDQTRDIRFRPAQAHWRSEGLPFELMFFHLGGYHQSAVGIEEITPSKVQPIVYKADLFDFGRNRLPSREWGDIGFAGWRAHHVLNRPDYKDEVIAFLGASYFRAVGKGQQYGLSARGLAVDTVGGQGEEFPRFTRFWVQRPTKGEAVLTAYALLDSPRVTGAYRFDIRPGVTTTVDVRMRVFLRKPVATLGVAPLTSMFVSGENQPHPEDYRPEVHDSDGLQVALATREGRPGEWLWRPLHRPNTVQVNGFQAGRVHGFGLMQRDRRYASYEDPEARYERRPSVWVEPVGDWGAGRVELVQLPAPDETHDNIVAYWVPQGMPKVGESMEWRYRLHWEAEREHRPPGGWAVQTRMGRGWAPLPPGEAQYVVDFDGPVLDALPADARLEAVATVGPGGTLLEQHVFRNEPGGTWRMTLRVRRVHPTQPVELRAFLRRGGDALTETWTMQLPTP